MIHTAQWAVHTHTRTHETLDVVSTMNVCLWDDHMIETDYVQHKTIALVFACQCQRWIVSMVFFSFFPLKKRKKTNYQLLSIVYRKMIAFLSMKINAVAKKNAISLCQFGILTCDFSHPIPSCRDRFIENTLNQNEFETYKCLFPAK